MSFGENLQFLRKLNNGMTQETLAEKMQVSRQTVSKWELGEVYPEINKVIELCQIFSCTMDNLFREDMNVIDKSYSNIRVEEIEEFRYVRYAVISIEPEEDAITHMREWAARSNINEPQIIGWDFPFVTQEQINVFHMHGYAAACILPPDIELQDENAEIITQHKQKYAAITIKGYMDSPFNVIPNAYKTLMTFMSVNGLKHNDEKDILSCYEKEYTTDGTDYMDIYIAIK